MYSQYTHCKPSGNVTCNKRLWSTWTESKEAIAYCALLQVCVKMPISLSLQSTVKIWPSSSSSARVLPVCIKWLWHLCWNQSAKFCLSFSPTNHRFEHLIFNSAERLSLLSLFPSPAMFWDSVYNKSHARNATFLSRVSLQEFKQNSGYFLTFQTSCFFTIFPDCSILFTVNAFLFFHVLDICFA